MIQYMVSMSLTGCHYHKPLHSVRPEPVEGRKLRPMIDRAKHPSNVHPERGRRTLRMDGDGTRQSH